MFGADVLEAGVLKADVLEAGDALFTRIQHYATFDEIKYKR